MSKFGKMEVSLMSVDLHRTPWKQTLKGSPLYSDMEQQNYKGECLVSSWTETFVGQRRKRLSTVHLEKSKDYRLDGTTNDDVAGRETQQFPGCISLHTGQGCLLGHCGMLRR